MDKQGGGWGGTSEGWRQDRPMETELTTVLWCKLCILIHARARQLGGEARKLTKGDMQLDLAETLNCWPIQWSRKAERKHGCSGSVVIINDSDDDSADDYYDGVVDDNGAWLLYTETLKFYCIVLCGTYDSRNDNDDDHGYNDDDGGNNFDGDDKEEDFDDSVVDDTEHDDDDRRWCRWQQ